MTYAAFSGSEHPISGSDEDQLVPVGSSKICRIAICSAEDPDLAVQVI